MSAGTYAISANPSTIWVPGAGTNAPGNGTCWPVWTLHNTGTATTANQLELWSYTAGRGYARFGVSLGSGSYLRLDGDTGRAYTSPDGTAWTASTEVWGYPRWVPIVGGTPNKIIVFGIASGTLTAEYTGRYE